MKIPYNDEPRDLGDGWQLSTPEAEGFDAAALRAVYGDFFAENQYVTAISLTVIRHGRIVAEGYCRDLGDIYRLNALQSATKSVTSVLTGMVLGDGGLTGVDQPVYDIIPDKFDDDLAKRAITVQDLVTMRSGLDFPNEQYSRELLIDGHSDSLAYILAKPLVATPGTEFDYIDADPHLVAGLLQRALGRSLEDYADERLFGPLGITDKIWETYRDGITYGAVGLYLTPRDFAKFGLLVAQGGVWDGQPLVPAAWLTESTTSVVDTNSTATLGVRYAYYWWTVDDIGAFTSDGHGGQFTFVVPGLDLLVVMTAEPHTKNGVAAIELDQFLPLARRIVATVVN